MLIEFKLPELGENIKGGTAVKVTVKVGQTIKKDQSLLELETDKATIEVPSTVSGVIKEILFHEGAQIKVGQVIMRIESQSSAQVPNQIPEPTIPQPKAAEPIKATESSLNKTQSNVEPVTLAQAHPLANAQPVKDIAAAPTVRRFAREIGINISDVPGSGPGGRISIDDVKAFAKQILSSSGNQAPSMPYSPLAKNLPDFTKWGAVERKPMNNIRRITAENLSYAWAAVTHVTQFDKADITNLERIRKKYSRPDRKLSITPFLIKVVAAALKNFPQFNASIDMSSNELIFKKFYNIGVAVDTPNGLVVPVLRDVDKKGVLQLSDELNEIAQRARDKKLSIEDMRGGTFTISNLGGIGGTSFTPIVNWPEVSILGVSRAQMEPKYDNAGHFIPALMLPLSFSYDHRIIDGADGARFIRWVAEAIEQPFLMELS